MKILFTETKTISVEIQEVEQGEKLKARELSSSCPHNDHVNRSIQEPLGRSCDVNLTVEDKKSTLPLLHLVKQLLRNASTQTHMRLQVSFEMNPKEHIYTLIFSLKAIAPDSMSMISSAILTDTESERIVSFSDDEIPPSIQLLLRFQRLLISRLIPDESANTKRLIQEGNILSILF